MPSSLTQDFILLIMNCKLYKNKAIKQKQTWLKGLPPFLKYFHVIGEEALPKPFLIDETNHILFVKTKDDYNSLPHKVIAAFMAMRETYQFKYVFKTDDDQVLLNPFFFNTLKDKLMSLSLNSNKYHYGGKIININTHKSTYFLKHRELPPNLVLNASRYCNGRFYFLSSEAVEQLTTQLTSIQKEYIEDYAIGYYLAPIFKENILYLNSSEVFKDNSACSPCTSAQFGLQSSIVSLI